MEKDRSGGEDRQADRRHGAENDENRLGFPIAAALSFEADFQRLTCCQLASSARWTCTACSDLTFWTWKFLLCFTSFSGHLVGLVLFLVLV